MKYLFPLLLLLASCSTSFTEQVAKDSLDDWTFAEQLWQRSTNGEPVDPELKASGDNFYTAAKMRAQAVYDSVKTDE